MDRGERIMAEHPLKIGLNIDINDGAIVRVFSDDDVLIKSLTVSKSINGKEQEVEFISYEEKE